MQKRPLSSASSEAHLDLSILERFAEGWLLDGEIRQHSPQTNAVRRIVIQKLLWFLKDREYPACGTQELRQFLAYLTRGHNDEGGRWGNPQLTRPVRPRTVKDYHGHLRTFFRWIVTEGAIGDSPMEPIAAPISRPDQIQPFTDQQLEALLAAAKKSTHPKRDEAIVLLLLDTGLRASELCGLRLSDLDMQNKRLSALGKGSKHRTVSFGRTAARSLWNYLREDPREPESPLFLSDRGTGSGGPMTRSGLLQLMERLGARAGIQATRCSPHTFRHTFAVSFLRNGGNVFTLQQILGHTSLTMTNRYVALAQADIERQHRMYSPVDALKGGVNRRG